MLRKISLFMFLVLFASLNFIEAHDAHCLTEIIGDNIELKSHDHTIAGSIRDFVIFAIMPCGESEAKLIMRKDGQTIKTTFKRNEDGYFGGVISHQTEVAAFETEIFIGGINKEELQIFIYLNNQKLKVQVSSDGVDGRHFINPMLSTTFNGENVTFKMVDGEACLGFISKLALVIFGAYFH